jgi:hypothetical protein
LQSPRRENRQKGLITDGDLALEGLGDIAFAETGDQPASMEESIGERVQRRVT